MGLINLEPTLHEGEKVLWRRPAARSLSTRMVAGTMYLTSEAVLFMPNRFNRRSDLVSTRIPRERIAHVDTVNASVSLASRRNGGMRRRLRVTVADVTMRDEATAHEATLHEAALDQATLDAGTLEAATREETHLFVINHPERVAQELRAALRGWPEQA